MTVLIVDDQINVLSGIISGVDWASIGATDVETAYNAEQAKRILLQKPVDIMLCDIEMPVENGLSLFRWVKSQKQDLECIFLTAHADFIYAKEAIQLGGFDYILQPARYEDIQNVVIRAWKKIQERREMDEYSSYGKMIYQQKNIVLRGILLDWFWGRQVDLFGVISDLNQLDIPVSLELPACVVLMQILHWEDGGQPWEPSLIHFAINNILFELFENCGIHILLIQMDANMFGLLLYRDNNQNLDSSLIQEQLEYFIKVCIQYIGCSISCYAANCSLLSEVTSRIKGLLTLKKNNVALESKVFFLEDSIGGKNIPLPPINYHQWEELLVSGNPESMRQDAFLFLEQASAVGALNAEALKRFYQDFFQMLSIVANRLSISLHQIFYTETMMEQSLVAYHSVQQMKEMITHVVNYFKSFSSEDDSQKQIDRIMQYIHTNIEKELRRTDIAQAVFLSPDYISRLFKKEKGVSLKEFISLEKMKVARNLLRTTSLPVSTIAIKVGYGNFSHFSQVYKKLMGNSPNEERDKKY